MCELLGMSFNQPVRINYSLRGFIHRGERNPDGWGLAWYPDGSKSAQVIKEALPATTSPIADFIKGYPLLNSPIYISHVRYATSEVCYDNTHPFQRHLRGRVYTFAHNGSLTLDRGSDLTGKWKPVGTTDSEYALCYLMNVIEQVPRWSYFGYCRLEEAMQEVNEWGKFNCLLSDGEYLFCYRDKDGRGGLSYTHRQAPFDRIRMQDEDLEIDLGTEKPKDEEGYIVATRPLTDEAWTDLKPGHLVVFLHGEMIYPRKN